jgi:hypothetical protein
MAYPLQQMTPSIMYHLLPLICLIDQNAKSVYLPKLWLILIDHRRGQSLDLAYALDATVIAANYTLRREFLILSGLVCLVQMKLYGRPKKSQENSNLKN